MWAATRMKASAGAAMTPSAADIRAEITAQVVQRGAGKTICPSEVARAFGPDWRGLMPLVRDVAAQMADDGQVLVTQKGQVVRMDAAKGPVRLGLG